MRLTVLAAVCALAWAGALRSFAQPETQGSLREGILPDPAQECLRDEDPRPEFFVCRILDATTGEPVAGARWIRTPEWIAPSRARHDVVLAIGDADRDGIAYVPTMPEAWSAECHWLVVAPGYAASHEYGKVPETEVLLERGVPFSGRVLDPLGRPVAHAKVEILGGCSHGTAAASTTTDAAGRFHVARVPSHLPGQIWVAGKGIAADLLALDWPCSLGGGETLILMGPGVRYEGRVVDLVGHPVGGVVVRAYNEQRGPTAMTDDDGQFVIHGVGTRNALYFFHPADLLEDDGRRMVEDAYPEVPMTVVLTPLGVVEPEANAQIHVRAIDTKGAPVGGVLLRAIDVGTGRGPWDYTANEAGDEEEAPPLGAATLEVVAGTHRILPSAELDGYAFDLVEVTVGAGETVVAEVLVRPQPQLRIEGTVPEEAELVLAVPGAVLSTTWEGSLWAPALPAGVPAVLRVEAPGRAPQFFSVEEAREGARRVLVSLPAPRRIEVPPGASQVELYDGTREAYSALVDGTITTDATGRLTVRWTGKDGNDYEARVVVPDAPGATVRVDSATRRPGSEEVDVVAVEVDGDGEAREIERVSALTGEMVVIQRPGWQTLRAIAPATGEAFLQYGTAGIHLQVRDADGPCDALALVGGEVHAAPGGQLRLRGLPEGTLRVVLGRRDELGPLQEIHLVLHKGQVHEEVVSLTD